MASPETKTDILNMALGRIGSKKLTVAQITANTDPVAIKGNLIYEQTRDALIRSHWWRFAAARAELSATTTPDFEWDYAYTLPDDFLAMRSIYEDNNTIKNNTIYSYTLEGNLLLSDESTVEIRYTKKVETVTSFDDLFIEVFVISLALKLAMSIGQDRKLYALLKEELYGAPGKPGLMSKVRVLDKQEQNTRGRVDIGSWNAARVGSGRIASKMGS